MSLLPITMDNVTVARRGKTRLGPLSMTLPSAPVTVVMGPNGSGKTTFLRALHGLERLKEGDLTWPIPRERVQSEQAYVFQTPILLRRSVLDNLTYPLGLAATPKNQRIEKAQDWLERIGLIDAAHAPASRISGGEKQKLALARALITDPKLVFLDEPCSALDGRSTRQIEEILQQTVAQGTQLIMATHDQGQARRLADHLVFLMHGACHWQGNAKTAFKTAPTPQIQAFLKGDIIE